jgi:uncharacterized short protein YbdD (DUF466 family)
MISGKRETGGGRREVGSGKQHTGRGRRDADTAGIFSRAAAIVRAILGVPDYESYVAHMRQAHPGDRVMSETEFRLARMNDRYNRTSRCC